jgi:two-component system, NarL family, nitrate/nitrite response regulator NarL
MYPAGPISIIIADDHTLFADSLEQLLTKKFDFNVLATARTGEELINLLASHQPDIILLDMKMPGLNGIQSAEMIRKSTPQQKIIFVSMHSDPELIEQCRALGINGFILKNTSASELIDGILRVAAGHTVFQERPDTAANQPQLSALSHPFRDRFKISLREYEVIQMIRAGLTSRQIAYKLNLSERTIETHRKNIFRKLNVNNVAALIRMTNDLEI